MNVARVPPGTHTFKACAYQSGIECVAPGEYPSDPQSACLTLAVVLTDDDLSHDLVFSPEMLPAQNCLMGTEQQR